MHKFYNTREKTCFDRLFAISLKPKTCQLNSKHNGPVLLFKMTFRHLGCFLLSVAMNGKDEHGFET